jgi:hypothetical protein
MLYMYVNSFMCLSATKYFKKMNGLQKGSYFCKRMVEGINVGSMQNLVSYILLRLWTH